MSTKLDLKDLDRDTFITGDDAVGRVITIGQQVTNSDTVVIDTANASLTSGGALTVAGAVAGASVSTTGNATVGGNLSVTGTGYFGGLVTLDSGLTSPSASSSTQNEAFGNNALAGITSGFGNTAIGGSSGDGLTSGNNNVFLGYLAGDGIDTASACVAIGNFTLGAADADNQVAIGYQAMRFSEGLNNIAIGSGALAGDSSTAHSGQFNIAIGTNALTAVSAVAWNNIAIGSQALLKLKEATNNLAIGKDAGKEMTTGENNVLIGGSCGNAITTGDSNILIGPGLQTTTVSSDRELRINYAAGTEPIISGLMFNGAGGNRVGINTTTWTDQLNVVVDDGDNCNALRLDMNDNGEAFINFEGIEVADTITPLSSHTTAGTLNGFIKIEINGTTGWIPHYGNPS